MDQKSFFAYIDKTIADSHAYEKCMWKGEVGMYEKNKILDKRYILAIGRFRLFFFEASLHKSKPQKLDPIHYYDLVALYNAPQAEESDKLELIYYQLNKNGKRKSKASSYTIRTSQVVDIVHEIRTYYSRITRNFPEDKQLKVGIPPMRLREIVPRTFLSETEAWLDVYHAHTAHANKASNEQFVFYLENMVLGEKSKSELVLHECPVIDGDGDLKLEIEPIFAALKYNASFLGIVACNLKRKEFVLQVANLLKVNKTITKVVLSGFKDAEPKHLAQVALALRENKDNRVQIVDLSNNKLSDKGLNQFTQTISFLQHGLTHINFANCNLTPKGLVSFFEALGAHLAVSLTIEYLNLSWNKLEDAGSAALDKWLFSIKSSSRLQHLLLAKCSYSMGVNATFREALKSVTSLSNLDISGNTMDTNTNYLLNAFVAASPSLKKLNVSNVGLSTISATAILEAIRSNSTLTAVEVDFSNNEDIETLEFTSTVKGNSPIKALNLSGIKFKEKAFIAIIEALTNSSVTALVLDNIFTSPPSTAVGDALCNLIHTNYSLKVLSVSGGYGKVVILPLLKVLEDYCSLTSLNISNNGLGDSGALAIASCLRKNCFLTRFNCDGNQIKSTGWEAIQSSLLGNRMLEWMTYPIADVEATLNSKKKLFKTLHLVQKSLKGGFVFEDRKLKRVDIVDAVAPESLVSLIKAKKEEVNESRTNNNDRSSTYIPKPIDPEREELFRRSTTISPPKQQPEVKEEGGPPSPLSDLSEVDGISDKEQENENEDIEEDEKDEEEKTEEVDEGND